MASWDRLRRDLQGLEIAPTALPARIGKYAVVRALSRTATSQLYLGRDPELDRPVAIKALRDDRDDPDFVRRFQREGAIAAKLRHPHVIAVHDVGLWIEEGGRETPYLVMDYVEGGTLAGKALGPREAAETMAAVADAIAHAHAQGVVHRDLKPANVLVDAAGRPIVTDFGLAKAARGDSVQTVEGSILGTPQYMAPEQVRGDSSRVDARTDVYALGAILYELLAGSPPYADPNLAVLFDRIQRGGVEPPSRRRPPVPRALDAVALKALARDPAARYASAADMARDLRAFLGGVPVSARLPRKGLRGASVVAVALLLLGGWRLQSSLTRDAAIRGHLGAALSAERADDLPGALEGYRAALAFEPENPEAKAGAERVGWRLSADPSPPEPETAWRELGGSASGGGISGTAGESFQLDLAVGDDGRPVVVWREMGGGVDDVLLRRWDGSAWLELGGGPCATPGPSRFPSVALDREGRPWVAWDDGTDGKYRLRLRRWDGASWEDWAALPEPPIMSAQPRLALDADGRPLLAWLETSGENRREVYLRRWDGSAWAELGGSATADGLSGNGLKCANPALALDTAGRPVVAWMGLADGRYTQACARWDGTAWSSWTVGGINRGAGWLEDRCGVSLDGDGHPVVAWQEQSGALPAIHARRWSGSAWGEMDGSATGEGVSRGTGAGAALWIAGRAVVWAAGGTGNTEIYLRLWDGRAWRELGGSASGGGISRTLSPSGGPVVRLDRDGNPVVAWKETIGKANEIYLKRFEEFAPAELRESRIDRDTVVLMARVRSAVAGAKVRLEVEMRPSGQAFHGVPTHTAAWTEPGRGQGIAITGLPTPWRARTMNDLGLASAWVEAPRSPLPGE